MSLELLLHMRYSVLVILHSTIKFIKNYFTASFISGSTHFQINNNNCYWRN